MAARWASRAVSDAAAGGFGSTESIGAGASRRRHSYIMTAGASVESGRVSVRGGAGARARHGECQRPRSRAASSYCNDRLHGVRAPPAPSVSPSGRTPSGIAGTRLRCGAVHDRLQLRAAGPPSVADHGRVRRSYEPTAIGYRPDGLDIDRSATGHHLRVIRRVREPQEPTGDIRRQGGAPAAREARTADQLEAGGVHGRFARGAAGIDLLATLRRPQPHAAGPKARAGERLRAVRRARCHAPLEIVEPRMPRGKRRPGPRARTSAGQGRDRAKGGGSTPDRRRTEPSGERRTP